MGFKLKHDLNQSILNIKMLQLVRIVTEENVLTIMYFICRVVCPCCAPQATIYASQDRNIFLIMMLENYLT